MFPVTSRRTRTIALALLAAAVVFRLWAMPSARFTGDESDYWAKSRQLATGQYRPVFGPEITGTEANLPGPAYYYLMAAPQALGASPYFGSVFVVLGHALAAWLLFLVALRARGERAGLVALALVAFAPWDVLYADRIWGSCVVPIWGALALYGAVKSEASGKWQAAMVFLCLVLPQLHLSVPVLWFACAVILVLRPPEKIAWKWIAVGVLLAFLAYLDPLVHELRTDFANTRNILTKGGTGGEPWEIARRVPFQVFGYAMGYASSEIGYHFNRGYWGGNFDDVSAYFSSAGWGRYFELHGPILGVLGVTSLGVALVGWTTTLARTTQRAIRAIKARSRDELELSDVLTLAILAGLAGGALLMMMARKRYFPHYANILVPFALWPAVAAIERWIAKKRAVGLALLAVTMTSMFFACVRYYRNIDSLNGLGNTIAMVERVTEEKSPVRIDFAHFYNIYAWQMIAAHHHGKPLTLHNRAPIRYRVDNRKRFEGEVPPGGEVFGGVLLTRTPPEGKPGEVGSAVRKAWAKFEVKAIAPDGTERACRPGPKQCSYGDHPWQHFGPDFMEIRGRLEPILFMHPIKDATVAATYPLDESTSNGTLKIALSDGATRSDNRAPVVVRLSQGDRLLAEAKAENRPGFVSVPFTVTATGARSVTIAITTVHDGARIFGFDLDLK